MLKAAVKNFLKWHIYFMGKLNKSYKTNHVAAGNYYLILFYLVKVIKVSFVNHSGSAWTEFQ